MLVVDYIIIGVVAVSGAVGFVRGFVKEALSLGTLVAAVLVAKLFASDLGNAFADSMETPVVRVVLAGSILFVGVLIIGAILNYALSMLIQKSGLSGTDRTLGVIFGSVRGILISALILVVAVAWISRDQLEAWRSESTFIPYLEQVVVWIRGLLPTEVAEYLQYEDVPELQLPDVPDTD